MNHENVVSPEQLREIAAAKSAVSMTGRPTVAALEGLIFDAIRALDHGFVRVIDYMGDDSSIVQAARVSYGRGTRRASEDRGLIRYLMRHSHTTPFEMASIKLHVKLPIFVARQWIRHRTASVNEYSARYSILDREFYVPEIDQLAAQSTINRQGREETLTGDEARRVLEILREDADRNYDDYVWMLNESEDGKRLDDNRIGVARELARMNLTLNIYTQWYWKIDLHNLMNFLALRMDAHAQYEIRIYAEIIGSIMKAWVPLTYEAFEEYRLNSVVLSGTAVKIVQSLLDGKPVNDLLGNLSEREVRDLERSLGHPLKGRDE
ncbi:FAD-dependent thymidylate synthase [Bradyrhizobium sp. WSM471]|uniref:FAD-dependent thymidylate synthase n=1 Tax=Bradyrhizobium sp. WSM471 TaxID=319017 RepID=UPI00024D1A80|nr:MULTISPECIES: FAD-dependent thymidylate synthase [Bradyrhizobium]EHQ99921.1 thymidylate synthase, flavin-dependent [Bradyrhizobium sp. WSM471]UFW42057.1 FAD-dependent thymidylate synthase [Bradyrhizobium canariense]